MIGQEETKSSELLITINYQHFEKTLDRLHEPKQSSFCCTLKAFQRIFEVHKNIYVVDVLTASSIFALIKLIKKNLQVAALLALKTDIIQMRLRKNIYRNS